MPPPITCHHDLREAARRRIPKALFDYVDRGAYDEATLRANRADLDAIALRQRVMVDVSQRDLACTLVGEPACMPVALAPTGLAGLLHGQGEVMAARAAQAFGVPFTLSTMSIASIEQVKAAVDRPFWFQLYVMRDRAFVRRLIERARAAECSALVLTVDLAAQAQRHQDVRNGLSVPPRLTLGHALNMASKPRWCWQMLRSPGRSFGNLEGFVTGSQGAQSLGQWIGSQFDASLSWRDVAWVRDLWPGKLVIKGLLDAEDAALAVAHGADAIVVSNHGGRQLDGTVSTMAALPGVVAEVGARCEVWVDGGIRSGQDVLKALALGARGTLIGRAFLHGLAAHGQAGVTTALTLIQRELDVSMALCGLRSVREVGPQALWAQAS